MNQIPIEITYEAVGEYSHKKHLSADTRLHVKIDHDDEHMRLAIIFHLINDFENSIIEHMGITRDDYEKIRGAFK